MPRYDGIGDHAKHGDIVDDFIELSDSDAGRKKRSIRKLLAKYGIDISYSYHMILVLFVAGDDFIGAKACIELGGNPDLIMDDDLMHTEKSYTKCCTNISYFNIYS